MKNKKNKILKKIERKKKTLIQKYLDLKSNTIYLTKNLFRKVRNWISIKYKKKRNIKNKIF